MDADTHGRSSGLAPSGAVAAILQVLVAGGGFCLSFGWIWFPVLSARVFADLRNVFSGTFLSGGGVCIFALALFAGFVASGFLARRLPIRNERALALLSHGGALFCLAAGLLAKGRAPRATAVLFGLAAACSGVFWITRLFALRPAQTGMALIVAALSAWLLSPAFSMGGTALVLPAGIILALGLSMYRGDAKIGKDGNRGVPSPKRATAVSRRGDGTRRRSVFFRDDAVSYFLLGSAFFSLGAMASVVPFSSRENLPASVFGIAMAVACCSRLRGRVVGAAIMATAMVVPAALHLIVFPRLTGPATAMAGFVEGAALIALPRMRKETGEPPEDGIRSRHYSRAGFQLAAIFGLVNLGGAVGAAAARTGDAGDWLVAAICVALCSPALLLIAKWRLWPNRNGEPAMTGEPAISESAAPRSPAHNPETTAWTGLTRRECEVAELLIDNQSNSEICAALFVSGNTARTHIKNIYHKTGAANREQLKELLRKGRPRQPG